MILTADRNNMIKTARSNGAVGKNAILPRFIAEIPNLKPHLILDFGCGKDAIHVVRLREQGFEFVFGIDLVPLSNPIYEMPQRLPWHLVYASNVLNVQPSLSVLQTTIKTIAYYANYGVAYLSYPHSPRKLGYSVVQMQESLVPYFSNVYRFTYRNTVVFKCVGKFCQKKLENLLTV